MMRGQFLRFLNASIWHIGSVLWLRVRGGGKAVRLKRASPP